MIRAIGKKDLKEAVNLVNDVFAEFVASGYSEEGKKTFYDYVETKYEELMDELDSGTKEFWGYFEGDRPLGVIAVRMTEDAEAGLEEHPHIALLFVLKEQHRKGIARQLFETVKRKYLAGAAGAENGGAYSHISVNSSPYAVEVYKRFGFRETGPEQELNGIRYVPMRLDV